MDERQARLAAAIYGGIIAAACVALVVVMRQATRANLAATKEFYRSMTERTDHAMWAAEVDAAGDAPGEGLP